MGPDGVTRIAEAKERLVSKLHTPLVVARSLLLALICSVGLASCSPQPQIDPVPQNPKNPPVLSTAESTPAADSIATETPTALSLEVPEPDNFIKNFDREGLVQSYIFTNRVNIPEETIGKFLQNKELLVLINNDLNDVDKFLGEEGGFAKTLLKGGTLALFERGVIGKDHTGVETYKQISEKFNEILRKTKEHPERFANTRKASAGDSSYILSGLTSALIAEVNLHPDAINNINIDEMLEIYNRFDNYVGQRGLGIILSFDTYYLAKTNPEVNQFLRRIYIDIDDLPNLSFEAYQTLSALETLNSSIVDLFKIIDGTAMTFEGLVSPEDVGFVQTIDIVKYATENHLNLAEYLKREKVRFAKAGELRRVLTVHQEDLLKAIHNVNPSKNIDWSKVPGIEEVRNESDIEKKIKLLIKLLGIETFEEATSRYHTDSSACNIYALDLFRGLGIKTISHLVDEDDNPVEEGGFELSAQDTGIWLSDHAKRADSYDETLRLLNEEKTKLISDREFVDITQFDYQQRIDLLKQGYVFLGTTAGHNWVVWSATIDKEFYPLITQSTYNLAAQYLSQASYKINGSPDTMYGFGLYAVYAG